VPCSIGWSDLGSWDVLSQLAAESNIGAGLSKLKKNAIEVFSEGNTIFSQQKKVYGLVGVDDLTVVDTVDALLVCKKGSSQNVKELVDKLKQENPKALAEHPFEIRPWGKFEILRDEDFFKSKIITVDPGQKISYQSHKHRSEHWVIVKGKATVILNDEEHNLKVGENIFIPAGAKHRIHNKSNEPVIFVEVQVGTYFGEDDIVRYQDDYGR